MKNFQCDFVALLVLFVSLSSRRWFKSSYDNEANLDFESVMTTVIKLLVSVLGDVTSACIKLLAEGLVTSMHNLAGLSRQHVIAKPSRGFSFPL